MVAFVKKISSDTLSCFSIRFFVRLFVCRMRNTFPIPSTTSCPAGWRLTNATRCVASETEPWPDSRRCGSSNSSGPDRRPEVGRSLPRSTPRKTCSWRNSLSTSIRQVRQFLNDLHFFQSIVRRVKREKWRCFFFLNIPIQII